MTRISSLMLTVQLCYIMYTYIDIFHLAFKFQFFILIFTLVRDNFLLLDILDFYHINKNKFISYFFKWLFIKLNIPYTLRFNYITRPNNIRILSYVKNVLDISNLMIKNNTSSIWLFNSLGNNFYLKTIMKKFFFNMSTCRALFHLSLYWLFDRTSPWLTQSTYCYVAYVRKYKHK